MAPFRIPDNSLPIGLERLAAAASGEAFRMVDRLILDHDDGSNTFSRPGESLWFVRHHERVIAVGGINIDPYYEIPTLGRIRHLYVHPDFRRCGVGTRLMRSIEASGAQHFQSFQLFTANEDASRFYESLGYLPVNDRWKVSHEKRVAA